ncbi:MAG: tRNA pseudouridine(38-40) synthase TruA [Desulfobacteraceae bacterium]|nr:tRNA pseudouridine(38-40) synthase TruA [Desulfobacteraceae bacterium]
MDKNFKIVIEYDGTRFFGWQRQKDRITIQGELEKVLSTILNQEIKINGSGRTDAGVHAKGQVANFNAVTKLECNEIKRGLNSLISNDIVVHHCEQMHDQFHARYNTLSKEYHYHILNQPDACAIGKDFVWHIRKPLDVEMMNACCSLILGTHDFKSFEGAGSPKAHTRREVFLAKVEQTAPDRLVFKIEASGFLKHMVRNLMGSLVDVGLSKMTPKKFQQILEAKDRKEASATAPAQGLFLMQVNYPQS